MRRPFVALATLALLIAFPSPVTTPGVALGAEATCDAFSQTTPGTYSCTVPEGVTTLYYIVAGGDGGAAIITEWEEEVSGGHGARITGSLTVTAGQVLDVVVGGSGTSGVDAGGGGGGYSSISINADPVVVAGGGGGGGFQGGVGGSGIGGDATAGGGWGGSAGPGGSGNMGGSGGRTGTGGDAGESFLGWDELENPILAYAGTGGTYGSGYGDGGNAEAGSNGGGGGGAFGGVRGSADGTSTTAGGAPGAGGDGGFYGGGGGGGYGGGGGGGGGTDSGGGGGGGSSLAPAVATLDLSLSGPIVSLSTSQPPDTSPPRLTLLQAAGQEDPTHVSPVNFALGANEAIDASTVTATDFTISTENATIGSISCSGTPTTCTIPVTPGASVEGVITIAPSSLFAVSDLSGNVADGAAGWDRSVTFFIPPPNDDYADAAVLSGLSGSVSGTTTDATSEGSEIFWFTYTDSVWYEWTNTGRKDVQATFSILTCAQSLRAFASTLGPPDWWPSNIVGWSMTGSGCTGGSTMSFVARAGASYRIQVAVPGGGTSGDFTLSWTTQAWTAVRGSLAVTLTNTRGEPASCTVSVKSVNLFPDREFHVFTGDGDEFSAKVDFESVGGRWTYAPVQVPASLWSLESGNTQWMGPASMYTSDGVTLATQKFVNRCHA